MINYPKNPLQISRNSKLSLFYMPCCISYMFLRGHKQGGFRAVSEGGTNTSGQGHAQKHAYPVFWVFFYTEIGISKRERAVRMCIPPRIHSMWTECFCFRQEEMWICIISRINYFLRVQDFEQVHLYLLLHLWLACLHWTHWCASWHHFFWASSLPARRHIFFCQWFHCCDCQTKCLSSFQPPQLNFTFDKILFLPWCFLCHI